MIKKYYGLVMLLSVLCFASGARAQESPQVSLDFLDNMEVSIGAPVTIKANFTNIGADKSINSFDYEFKLDGVVTSQHVSVSEQTPGVSVTVNGDECAFEFTIDAFEAEGTHDALLKITKLNDVEITKNRGSAKCDFTIKVLTAGYPRVVAIEEYTGVWCGYCPSGWVALEAMSRIFGDRVVSIAYHSNDVMTSDLQYPEYVVSLPYMRLNRTDIVKVTNIEEMINKRLAVDARAKIDIKAEWATSEGVSINITSNVVSADPVEANGYRIAYAIIHNNMRGSGSDWYQTDYGRREEPAYPEWNFLGGYLWYNDVLFDGTVMTGLENSVPALTPGQEYKHEYFIDLSKHIRPVLQNKKSLQVVALIVSKDNKIVNAAKCNITADPSWPLDGAIGGTPGSGEDPIDPPVVDPPVDPDPDPEPDPEPDPGASVSSVGSDEAAEVSFFNLDGTKVAGTPAPGMYLRRQGSKVTKVIISGNR